MNRDRAGRAGRRLGLIALGPALLLVAGTNSAVSATPASAPGTITTVAGDLGGPGPSESVGMRPCGVTFSGGFVYATDLVTSSIIADSSVIRKISMTTGALTTVAGNGIDPEVFEGGVTPAPDTPDGSLATAADLSPACGVARDQHGNLVIAAGTDYEDADQESIASGIRVAAESTGRFYGRSMVKGHLYSIVSPQNPIFAHVHFYPGSLTIDRAGNVLFTTDANLVYALAEKTGTFYGRAMRSGQLYVVAGGGPSRLGGIAPRTADLEFYTEHFGGQLDSVLRIDHHGNLLIADQGNCLIRVVANRSGTYYGLAMRGGRMCTIAGNEGCSVFAPKDGIAATKADLNIPSGLAVDHSGNVLVANNGWIEVVATVTGHFYGLSMRKGRLYRIAGSVRSSTGSGPARQAELDVPQGISVDGDGNVVIATAGGLLLIPEHRGPLYGRHGLRIGNLYEISGPPSSGDRGRAADAELNIDDFTGGSSPAPLATDHAGDLFLVNEREIRMIPGRSRTIFGQQRVAGDIYRIAGQDRFTGKTISGGELAASASLGQPSGLSVDSSGNLLVTDTGTGLVAVVAASSGTFYGLQMTAAHIYVVAGGGTGSDNGTLATAARIVEPDAVTADHDGTLLIAAGCDLLAVPAISGTHYGQAMTAGHIYQIAGTGTCSAPQLGGPASASSLPSTGQLMVDSAGNVLMGAGSAILAIAASAGTFYGQAMTAGDLYQVAPGTAKVFVIETNFTVDPAGNIVETDPWDEAVVVVAERTGSFYGRSMTAGSTYTIAGNGHIGHSGVGGPAASAALDDVDGIVSTASGDLIITEDHWLSRIAG